MTLQTGRNCRIKEGQVSGVLMTENPAEDRRLAKQLHKIDVEKKRRENTLSWNQRSFFIRQVFDQDNDLRFVKAQERPKYLSGIPPQEDEDEETSQPHEKQGKSDRKVRQRSRENSLNNRLTVRSDAWQDQESECLDKTPGNKNISPHSATTGDGGNQCALPPLPMPQSKQAAQKVDHTDGKSPSKGEVRKSVDIEPRSDDDTDQQQADAQPADAQPANKPRPRFPVVKIKALGLFAASARKATQIEHAKHSTAAVEDQVSIPVAKSKCDHLRNRRGSVSLPGSPIIGRKSALVRQSSETSLRDLTGGNSLLRKLQNSSLVGQERDASDKYLGGKENLSETNDKAAATRTKKANQSDKTSIWQKVSEMAEPHYRGKNTRLVDTTENVEGAGPNDELQDYVIRRLVRTLPTSLLLKTHQREAEAGGESTQDLRQTLLQQARTATTRRTVDDPRFKKLEKTLAGTASRKKPIL